MICRQNGTATTTFLLASLPTVLPGFRPRDRQALRQVILQSDCPTLPRRRDEFIAAGRERLTGHGDVTAAATENKRLQRELAERELIIGELTVANRFLRKKTDGSCETTSNGKR
jgi:hypothetical protein